MDIRWIFHSDDRLAILILFFIYSFNSRFLLILHLILIHTFDRHVLIKFLSCPNALVEHGSRCDRQGSMPSVDHSLLELGLILVLDVHHTSIFDLMASFSPL